MRYCEGDLVYAKYLAIEEITNIVDKAKRLVGELGYCVDNELYPLILETNSFVMKKIIEGEWDPPW